MVVNFETCEISRNAHKLAQTLTLIENKKELSMNSFQTCFGLLYRSIENLKPSIGKQKRVQILGH